MNVQDELIPIMQAVLSGSGLDDDHLDAAMDRNHLFIKAGWVRKHRSRCVMAKLHSDRLHHYRVCR